jgi:RNA polymerase sigma factor (sigma-70 family)
MGNTISKELAQQLFEQYSHYVLNVAYMLTQSQSLADDVTQETFLRIFKYYYTFDPSKPIKPWIYKITLNTVREIKRKQRWLTFFEKLPERKKWDKDIESKLMKQEEEAIIMKALNKISHKHKEIIILYYFEDFSIKEISEILSIPLGTCKSRLHHALKKLKRELNQNDMKLGGESYEV